MEDINESVNNIDDAIKDTVDSINEIVNEVQLYGFSDINEREIVYGISTAIGIDPSIDTVLEIGCNVGEFYFYMERLFGSSPLGYFGTENNDKFIDIARFRIREDNTQFYNVGFQSILNFINDNESETIKDLMDISIDWGVIINQFDEIESSSLVSYIEKLIQIPNKGLVITNKFPTESITMILNGLVSSDTLKNKFILRSDFVPEWYSLYFYNNR
jgi:SAM-dependent methyltransferase